MANRTKVVNIELSQPIELLTDLESYQTLQGLVRFRGVPLGYVWLPIQHGTFALGNLVKEVIDRYSPEIAGELIRQHLFSGMSKNWDAASLLGSSFESDLSSAATTKVSSVTVILCPRLQETAALSACLETLSKAATQPTEIIVALSSQDSALQSVQVAYPQVHWLLTNTDNRSIQRNLAIQAAKGEIVAFLDERCQVDAGWVSAVAHTFAYNPDAAAVTGLVVPDNLESESDFYFEVGYSLWRGCNRTWHQLAPFHSVPWPTLYMTQIGASVNVAFRKSLFTEIGTFDPALGQLGNIWESAYMEMMSRVLLSQHTVLYEPSAMVRYRGPKSQSELHDQVAQDMVGLYAYILASWRKQPALRSQFTTLGTWKLARLGLSLLRSGQTPRDLVLRELLAVGQSWWYYGVAQRSNPQPATDPTYSANLHQFELPYSKEPGLMGVCTVDLHQPLSALTEAKNYQSMRIFVTVDGFPIGSVDIDNACHPVSVTRLQQAIAKGLTSEILALAHEGDTETAWSSLRTALTAHLLPASLSLSSSERVPPPTLSKDVPVSIVITTCDRPDDLENCLQHLVVQQTQHPVEIVVADNRPASGITPAVVSKFPQVKLVQEPRPGGSYGRNAAIAASTGDIIVTVDDDVTVPADWLEKLIAPFARPEIMVVTGNLFPKELETPAQLWFEKFKGGLSAGFKHFEADSGWLASFQRQSPPIWELGVSANAAFRAAIFAHPEIGLMDEVLGPGTPTVGGEENHLIYKVLKAGYTLAYEPSAYAWHRHRREKSAFYRQVHGHMKGGTAYNLILWLKENDPRGFRQLTMELPYYLSRRVYERLRGWHDVPWRLMWSEISGYVSGFWGYWQSCQRVKRQGRSSPYIPVSQRPTHTSLPVTESEPTTCSSPVTSATTTIGGRER